MFAYDQSFEDSLTTIADARLALASAPVLKAPTALVLASSQESYRDAAARMGMGWSVGMEALRGADGAAFPGAFGVRRLDTRAPLGVVGSRYTLAQNLDLVADLESCFAHIPYALRPRLVKAGALGGGSKVYFQAELPAVFTDALRVARDRDSETRAFLTCLSSHDGSVAVSTGASAVRIVCWNTFHMAGRDVRKNGLRLKHTASVVDNRARVNAWMRSVATEAVKTGDRLRAYAERSMAPARVVLVADEIIAGEPVASRDDLTRQQRAASDAIVELIETRDGTFVPRGEVTAYSVLQAVTAFDLHMRAARGSLPEQTETRAMRVLTGDTHEQATFSVLDRVLRAA
jgi:hypothetical protein